MIRYWRLGFAVFLLLLVYSLYWIHSQAIFEDYLNTLFITFEDFPADYSNALIESQENKTPLEYDYSLFPHHDPASMIPPTIHFIWFKDLYETHPERTKIPSVGSVAPELCRNHNPDFTVNVWNATAAREFLEKHYAWFLPTYDSYRYPIQRVDAFKYFVLWHEGGVYMDMDISCRRPLTPLLQFPAWFPRASPLGVNNDIMASRAQHPVIKKMSESLEPRNKNLLFPYVTIFWTTGPRFTTDIFKVWLDETPGEKYVAGSTKQNSDPDKVYVLPQEFYSEQYTFFGHSPGGTWYGPDVAVVLWLIDRPWVPLLVLIFFLLSCAMIARRRRRRPKKTVFA